MSNTLNYLNNIKNKSPYLKQITPLKQIPLNEKIRILKCSKKITKFGPKTMMELENCVIFLPEKYTNLPEEVMNDMSTGDFYFQKILDGNYFDFIFEK